MKAAKKTFLIFLMLALVLALPLAKAQAKDYKLTAVAGHPPIFLWVGLAGAMVAAREDRQITIDALTRLTGPRARQGIRTLTALFTAVVCLAVTWHAVRLVQEDRLGGMTAFGSVPVWVCELILPIAFLVIGLRYAVATVGHLRRLGRAAGAAP